jgi:hypothetical protein
MKNGTRKSQRAKRPARKQTVLTKPAFNLPRPGKNGRPTPEYAEAYEKYLRDLRTWLWSLPESRFDREIRKLPPTEVFHLNWLNTYTNYQEGGPMREIA